MGKTTVKSSKSDSKSKKATKPVKAASSVTSSKKITKPMPKKVADNKLEKKSDSKSVSSKSAPIQKTPAKTEKSHGKDAKNSKEFSKLSSKSSATSSKSSEKGVLSKDITPSKSPSLKGAEKKDNKEVDSKKVIESKSADKINAKKVTPEKESSEKQSSKTSPVKKKTGDKKEEFAIEDDLVGETEDFTSDELLEYQTELENAEEEIEEKEIVPEEVVAAPAAVIATSLVNKDKSDEVVLTDAEGRRYCRVKDCDQVETVDAYCRYHYLLLWKRIQIRKKILTDGKLERYVEELTSRYPDKFLEVIRRDLRSEKDFIAAIQEMEIDESSSDNDFEDESSNFIDEVRGASTESLVEDDEY